MQFCVPKCALLLVLGRGLGWGLEDEGSTKGLDTVTPQSPVAFVMPIS